jgi:hypothetical protein
MPRHFIPVLFRGDRLYGVVRGGLDVERSGFALSAILANSRGARGFLYGPHVGPIDSSRSVIDRQLTPHAYGVIPKVRSKTRRWPNGPAA